MTFPNTYFISRMSFVGNQAFDSLPTGGLDSLIRDLTIEERRLIANRLNGKFPDGILIFAAL